MWEGFGIGMADKDKTVQELLKEDDYINVGYAIKELRDSYRETQQQFAYRIGI